MTSAARAVPDEQGLDSPKRARHKWGGHAEQGGRWWVSCRHFLRSLHGGNEGRTGSSRAQRGAFVNLTAGETQFRDSKGQGATCGP